MREMDIEEEIEKQRRTDTVELRGPKSNRSLTPTDVMLVIRQVSF